MTDHFFTRQHKDASDTRMLIILALMSAAGIFAGIYVMTDRGYDHEQLSLEPEHVEQAAMEWRLR